MSGFELFTNREGEMLNQHIIRDGLFVRLGSRESYSKDECFKGITMRPQGQQKTTAIVQCWISMRSAS